MFLTRWAMKFAVLSAAVLVGGSAFADDHWSGFYAGVHGGFGGADVPGRYNCCNGNSFLADNNGIFDLDPDGIAGGFQAGFNMQSGYYVYGVEADVTFTDWEETQINGSDELIRANVDILGSVRGKAGYAMNGTLIYGTAGIAWVDGEYYANDHTDSPFSNEMGSVDFSDTGLVIGAGAAKQVTPRFSVQGDALFYFFNDRHDTSSLTHDSESGDFVELENAFVVRVGGNVHFSSDRRLKYDISHLAKLPSGIDLYSYKYIGDDQVRVGVMAQDILADETLRGAVAIAKSGFYAVNYEALGLKMATLEAWGEHGLEAVLLRPGVTSGSL